MSRTSQTSIRAAMVCNLALVLSSVAAAQDGRGKFVPPDGKILVFVGAGWGDQVEGYTKATGHVPSGVNIFGLFSEDTTFIRHCEKNAPAGAAMAITLKFVQPSGRDGGNPRDPSLVNEILGSKRDRALAAMAEAFKRTRRPIFVNLGSESNNSFFITPEESIAAFRYVHDRWRRLGVRNVAYVWKPGPGVWQPGVGLVNGNFGDFYPGDDYVDWIAGGYYGGDPETVKHTGGLKTFYTLSQLAWQRGKPFMIAESGPFSGTVGTGGRQTWDSWFRPYFEDIRRFGVRAVVYNNFGVLPDDPKWGEQRIARMERSIQEAWGREMKDPMYMRASPDLYDILEGRKRAAARHSSRPGTPYTLAKGKPFNLLTRLDPRSDAIEGDWRLTGTVLTFAGDKEWSRIEVPYQPPEEYDLTVVAERVRGTEILVIGLVVGGKQAMVLLDGWGGGVSGLERIDGKVSQDNPTTHRGWRFINGRPVTIVCRVRRGSVSASCDGRPLFDWRGNPDQLSLVAGWKVPDEDRLFLGGWKGGVFRFCRVEIRDAEDQTTGDVKTAGTARPPATGKFCPPKGKRLLIIGQDRDSMEAYIRDTGQVPGGFMAYNHLNAFDGLMGIEPRYIDGLHDFSIAKRHPDTVLQVGLVFKEMEREIIVGVHDDRIDRLAEWFKRADIPIYLRIGPEFDLPSDNEFRWPAYQPEAYKLAFRHIVERFRRSGAENVAFVWHSAAGKGVERAWAYYPGDDFVDWFAVTHFGRGNDEGAALFARYARQRGKPLMIAESSPLGGLVGTRDGEQTWESWFRPFFEYIERNDVRVVCFIPIDWESIETYRGKGWRDTRVQAVPAIRRRWLAEVGRSEYLKASKGLFDTLGYRRMRVGESSGDLSR